MIATEIVLLSKNCVKLIFFLFVGVARGTRIIKIEKLLQPTVTVKFVDNISKTTFPRKLEDALQLTDLDKNRVNLIMILTHSNANPFSGASPACQFCHKKFLVFKHLKEHFIEEHREQKFLHKNITKFFPDVINVDITDLTCTVCDKNIDDLESFLQHLQAEHKTNVDTEVASCILPFKFDSDNMRCAVCHAEFITFKLLREHMNIHFRNFICDICSAGFVTERNMTQHVKRHASGEFRCDQCEKTFSTEVNLRDHKKRTHLGLGKRNLCSFCGERFMDYWKKKHHMVKEHGAPPVVLKCQACERTFDNQRSLTRHTKKDHLMERKHNCLYCDMTFFSKSCLQKHMVKHTGQRTHKCEVCLKAYARKSTLREHMRIHANDRRFSCSYCGLAFVQKCSWRGHMRSKHGECV